MGESEFSFVSVHGVAFFFFSVSELHGYGSRLGLACQNAVPLPRGKMNRPLRRQAVVVWQVALVARAEFGGTLGVLEGSQVFIREGPF